MAEPPVGHPPASADGLDGVLATKLYLPRPQQGFVPRPRLVERLEEALARGLVVVCAPAGFGKTVLLADWARQQRRPVAWLSLDPGDNDPTRFWRHVVAALDRTRPGLAERLAPLLGPPAPASFEGLVTALINRLASQQGDGEALLILYDTYYSRMPDGTWPNLLEAFQVIVCMDSADRPTLEEYDANAVELSRLAPRFSPGTVGGYDCAWFPPSEDPRVAITAAGAGPIVVIGTTGDPATPLAGTEAMASALQDGRLVVVDADQHTGYGTNSCVVDVVHRYLIDLEAPPARTDC